jgi:ribonuclease T1
VKRAWFLLCSLALCLALSSCDDGGHGQQPRESSSAASAAPAANAPSQAPQATRQESPARSVSQEPVDGLNTVQYERLPRQAIATLQLIESGGPFPFEKDGVVFGNFERALPPHPRGFYHEYTVPTPRARNRGARRIVCGGPRRQIDNCYYTDDHYASFKRIAG